MSVAEEKSEIKLISSVIESIKPSFSNSEIDQETLAKLEQLWIKKLKLLEERDEDDDDVKLEMKGNIEEGQTSELATTSSFATEAEPDEDLETIVVIEEIDSNDGKDEVASATDVLEKDVEEHNFKVSDGIILGDIVKASYMFLDSTT